MRIVPSIIAVAAVLGSSCTAAFAQPSLVDAARARVGVTLVYDPSYAAITFPGGDVPDDRGVCTDVVIRSYRSAYQFDLQDAVHMDMTRDFNAYPALWGLTKPDTHIDHRRVPNLETFLKHMGAQLVSGHQPENFQPGDIVTWRIGGTLAHIGIVSDELSKDGTPLILHNMGWGTAQDDILFKFPLAGHFRFHPKPDDPPQD